MKFKKGKSGNPKGRPKGVPDKRTKLRALLEPHAEELIRVAVERALEGDAAALRLCLERLIPPIKSTGETVVLDEFTGSLTEKGEAIIAAVARGELTPDQAGELLAALASQARLVEAVELEQRIAKLEETQKLNDGGKTNAKS